MADDHREDTMSLRCAQCGSLRVNIVEHVEKFAYGIGDAAVTLSAEVLMHSCEECGFDGLDHVAQELMDKAVRVHLATKHAGCVAHE